jgi:SOS-response transcriptional repressor LexA
MWITELRLAQARGEFLAPRPVAASPPRDQPAVSGCDVDLEFDTVGVRPDAFTIPPGHIVFSAEGDSMRDADIEDGDLVLIRLTQEALNGQIALVEVVHGLTEEAALTLKRNLLEGDQVCLRPANPDHQPLYCPKTDIRVRGVAVERINRRRLR